MIVWSDEVLPTISQVREHLYRHRDLLSRCMIGFSGGKDSVALARLVHELEPSVPCYYLSCPGLEWPGHEAFVREQGAIVLDSGHDAVWYARNLWAFLFSDSATNNRWAAVHHRRILRRYAKEQGKILLWGNRLSDRNICPATRYRVNGCEIWLPIRHLSYQQVVELIGERITPLYALPSTWRTGYVSDYVRPLPGERELRYQIARRELPAKQFDAFRQLYVQKFGDIENKGGEK